MDAIGRLAGGIAHDFNNMLTAILGYCELLLDDPSISESQRGDIREIEKAGRTAAQLTRQLLAFSRREVMPHMNGPMVAEMLTRMRPELKVVFMSGYTDSAVVRYGVMERGVPFLQKPFTPERLANKIVEVLG
jgi:DNA-binding NtrC family response regulator